MNGDRVTVSWLRSLTDSQLRKVYTAEVMEDEYLSFGDAESPDRDLRRVRDEMERRGLL